MENQQAPKYHPGIVAAMKHLEDARIAADVEGITLVAAVMKFGSEQEEGFNYCSFKAGALGHVVGLLQTVNEELISAMGFDPKTPIDDQPDPDTTQEASHVEA